jgi:hypothetical protein
MVKIGSNTALTQANPISFNSLDLFDRVMYNFKLEHLILAGLCPFFASFYF